MTIFNGVNGHTNGSQPSSFRNGKVSTLSNTASISSTLSDLFDENITAKILHAAETGLINNVRCIPNLIE